MPLPKDPKIDLQKEQSEAYFVEQSKIVLGSK